MKMLTFNGSIYRCPHAAVLPPLTPEERARLAEDIRRQGVLVPLVVDDAHQLIDGHHRLEIAIEQGLTDVPMEIIPGLTDVQKRDLVEDLNPHRHHLTPDQPPALRQRRRGRDKLTARAWTRAVDRKLVAQMVRIHVSLGQLARFRQRLRAPAGT
jgi:ParB-like chromosome segregation protein Spo0J